MDELLRDFIIEASEALDGYDSDLVELESSPDNRELLNRIFRAMHTIKGTCGFLGFSLLEKLTHSAENLLDELRAGEIRATQEAASALLAVGDGVRHYLTEIESTGTEGSKEFGEVISTLEGLRAGGKQESTQDLDPLEAAFLQAKEEWVAENLADADKAPEILATPQAPSPHLEPAVVPRPSDTEHAAVPNEPKKESSEDTAPAPKAPVAGSASESTLRVGVGLLDELMNLVGELVLTRNQLLQYTKTQKDSTFLRTSQRLNLVTSELQESVMRTRMQPISTVWNRFPRIVRDIAHSCDKDVRLEMEGQETDLDKTIIEAIKDPMTHLVRNAVDHGVEHPQERREKGKPSQGTLTLRAHHEGGHVIIQISDDGAGLNYEKIKRKAVQRGLATEGEVARLSPSEIAKFIFQPGFSTSEEVSNISGRGVGMDVVRSNIEKIGGSIDISSPQGGGTTFKIKIPLTLAIVPALLVSSSGNRFAIPQVGLQELVRIEGEAILREIEEINGMNYYRLRGRLLPLVYLSQELGLNQPSDINYPEKDVSETSKEEEEEESSSPSALNIVVIKADDLKFGLVVDEIHDTEEIVVKPLKGVCGDLSIYAGATIMGDGSVALILDVVGLANKSDITSAAGVSQDTRSEDLEESQSIDSNLLIARLANDRRIAIPVEQVTRLEEISSLPIEYANDWPVIQYRGGVLPLVFLNTALGSADESSPAFAVVYTTGQDSFGFVVDEILDVTSESKKLDSEILQSEWRESAIIDDKVTELLDLPRLLSVIRSGSAQPSTSLR